MKKNVKAVTCAALSVMLMNSTMVLYAKDDETTKDETVYAMLNSDGTVDEEIVSSWLHNDQGIHNIREKLNLENVKNVKGDDQPTISGNTYTWNVESNDVYYEGTTTKALPVQVRVTYELDGKEISGEDLIGKSGKLKIHISLHNTESQIVAINGKQTRIHPFYMGAGMVDLSTDHFSNISCEGAKILSEGNNTVVAFVSIPGLQDTLESAGIDKAEDLHIQDEFTITCDTKDFELGPIMFAMTPEVPLDKLKDINSLDDLTKGLDELTNASEQLLSGTEQLADGTATFQAKMGELVNGVPTLTNGVASLKSGSEQLVNGSVELNGGLKDLSTGLKQAKNGTSTLSEATNGLNDLVSGIDQINTNMQSLSKGLSEGSETLNATLDTEQLSNVLTTISELPDQIITLADNMANLNTAAQGLNSILNDPQMMGTSAAMTQDAESLKNVLCSTDSSSSECQLAEKLTLETGAVNNALYGNVGNGQNASNISASMSAGVAEMVKNMPAYKEMAGNMKTTLSNLSTLLQQLDQMKTSMNTAAKGAQQLAQGTQQLKDSTSSLIELKKGIDSLDASMSVAATGANTLYQGSQSLTSGITQVDKGIGTLQSGSSTLQSGAMQLYDASTLLNDKTNELHEGMSKFKTSGIDEMNRQVNLSLADVTQLLAIKDEIIKQNEQLHTFSGAPVNSESKVKFIYKTAELQKEK